MSSRDRGARSCLKYHRGVPLKPPRKRPPLGRTPDKGAPQVRVGRVPRARAVAKPPNPRTPDKVPDIGGGVLKDLFRIFPDLPRPPRPRRSRVPVPRSRRLR